MQFTGVFFGVLAVVPARHLMVPEKAVLEAFNPPATNRWYAVAEALSTGISTIPKSARYAIVIGGLVGIVLPGLESLFPKARKFLPSSTGLGLAFVVSFANSSSFFIGPLIALVWMKRHKETGEWYIMALASGAIAGESLGAAAHVIASSLGIIRQGASGRSNADRNRENTEAGAPAYAVRQRWGNLERRRHWSSASEFRHPGP